MLLPIAQVLTLSLVSVALACALAHALELPGKLRLSEDAYRTVQRIYYPGFTLVGGFAEVFGVLAAWALLALTPAGSAAFRLTLAAALAMTSMQAVFWLFTQPANREWMREQPLPAASRGFFQTGSAARTSSWEALRNRWEYSHVARAVLSFGAFVLLASAVAAS